MWHLHLIDMWRPHRSSVYLFVCVCVSDTVCVNQREFSAHWSLSLTMILSAICWICCDLVWMSSFSLVSLRSTISSLFTWFSRVFLPSCSIQKTINISHWWCIAMLFRQLTLKKWALCENKKINWFYSSQKNYLYHWININTLSCTNKIIFKSYSRSEFGPETIFSLDIDNIQFHC